MTTFQDGPAKGMTLMLKRTPVYLRVVCSLGKVDTLDQLKDTPRDDESVHAYRMNGEVRGSCSTTAGRFNIADYSLCDPQPSDATMRILSAWQDWTHRDWLSR